MLRRAAVLCELTVISDGRINLSLEVVSRRNIHNTRFFLRGDVKKVEVLGGAHLNFGSDQLFFHIRGF